jgi:hypothetical protein
MLKRIALCGLVAFCGSASLAFADLYNAVNDFPTSITTGTLPVSSNGVWSYGYSVTLPVTFLPDLASPNYFGDGNAAGFSQSGDTSLPTVLQNISSGTLNSEGGTIGPWPTNLLLMHPGPTGNYSVVQFTAPSTGRYTVSGEFVAMGNFTGETTDSILTSTGSLLFTGYSTSAPSFDFSTSLTAGESLDFVVGLGPQGQFMYDSTGFNATITPEPSLYGILALGLACFAAAVCRRNR